MKKIRINKMINADALIEKLEYIRSWNNRTIEHNTDEELVNRSKIENNLLDEISDIISNLPEEKIYIEWTPAEAPPPEEEKVFVLVGEVYPFTYVSLGWRVGDYWIVDNRPVTNVIGWAKTPRISVKEVK